MDRWTGTGFEKSVKGLSINELSSCFSGTPVDRSTGPPLSCCRDTAVTICLQTRHASGRPVPLLELDVRLHGLLYTIAVGVGRLTDDLAGHTQHERVGRDAHSFDADRARADDRAGTYVYTVEQNRAHRDQAIVFDRRAVHDGAMTDGDTVSNVRRDAIVNMNDGSILNVAVVADHDRVGVAANHRGGPHRDALSESHVAGDDGGGMDERGGIDHGGSER